MRRRLPIIAAGLAVVAIGVAFVAAPRTATMEGVIVAVESTSLASVTGFTLRIPGGELVEFELGVLENEAEFPRGHLAEHVASSAPVVVTYRDERGGRRLAVRIADAPVATPS